MPTAAFAEASILEWRLSGPEREVMVASEELAEAWEEFAEAWEQLAGSDPQREGAE